MTDEQPFPTNVIEAIARIMEELGPIAKTRDPDAGVKYAFRGIEQITGELQDLAAKYHVVPVPHRVRKIRIKDITVNNNPWTDTQVVTRWRFYGPGGLEDFIEAETFSIGRDNSDKGANKAATQALKYLLLPTFLISDKRDDVDSDWHPTDRDTTKYANEEQMKDVARIVLAIPDQGKRLKARGELAAEYPPPLPIQKLGDAVAYAEKLRKQYTDDAADS